MAGKLQELNDNDSRSCWKISGDYNEKKKARKGDGKEEGDFENMNTEDGVTLRGRGCNVPLAHPRYLKILIVYCTHLLVRSSRLRPHQ